MGGDCTGRIVRDARPDHVFHPHICLPQQSTPSSARGLLAWIVTSISLTLFAFDDENYVTLNNAAG
jgi:hypothetical protein